MVGMVGLLLAGCSSDSKPQTASETKCEGGNTCKCPKLGASITRCMDDGSEVCDCPCSDFQPTKLTTGFESCKGPVSGAWELTSVDLSQVATDDGVEGCLGAQVDEPEPLTWLMYVGNGDVAEVARATETIELRQPISCVDPTKTCDALGSDWSEDSCGACAREFTIPGAIDDNASWSAQKSIFRISRPDVPQSVSLDYEYCPPGDGTLALRTWLEPHVIYHFAQRYLTGTSDSCLDRSSGACEKLDGCHVGRCNGTAACPPLDNQTDCEAESLCTWTPDKCGGIPTKICSIKDYGVDPDCVVSEMAP